MNTSRGLTLVGVGRIELPTPAMSTKGGVPKPAENRHFCYVPRVNSGRTKRDSGTGLPRHYRTQKKAHPSSNSDGPTTDERMRFDMADKRIPKDRPKCTTVEAGVAAIYARAAQMRGEAWPPQQDETSNSDGVPAAVTIYFIGPVDGPIKIGFARRLSFRLKELSLANAYPLQVWAAVEAPASLEREYHRRFAGARLHGEWFTRTPEIEAEIARLNQMEQAA